MIKIQLQRGDFGDGILLGDSGYANENYLITPVRFPQTRQEKFYNIKHKKTRRRVECAIGIWKRRFPVIKTALRLKLQNSLKVIVATAVLHNIAIGEREASPATAEIEINPIYEVPIPSVRNVFEGLSHNTVRDNIIANL